MRLDLRGTGRHRGVTGFAVGVIATMTIAGGGVALASIPSSSTAKFTGCVAKQGGALRVIDAQAGKKCKSSEKKITWSKGWTHRGGWASGTTYKPGDVVTQSGSSYVAKSKSTGVSPSADASEWGLLAAAGATGDDWVRPARDGRRPIRTARRGTSSTEVVDCRGPGIEIDIGRVPVGTHVDRAAACTSAKRRQERTDRR